jgi:uncharacterized lipoprotein YmbA
MKALVIIALSLLSACASAPTIEHDYYQIDTCRTDTECTIAAINAGWPEEDWP